MLIDDEPADNFFHSRTIRKLDCTEKIIAFENPTEALAYLENVDDQQYVRPDLIFLDINMPIMNGWEFLEHYQQLDPNLHGKIICVMLTTSINPSDKEKAKSITAIDQYLSKPLDKSSLQKILSTYFP